MGATLAVNLPNGETYAEILPLLEDSQDLARKVTNKVQDASYSYDDILAVFNRCLRAISGKFLLPDLEVLRNIETDSNQPSIPVPADYQKNLRYAHSTTQNRKIAVFGSVIQLYRNFSVLDQTGRVVGMAVKGRFLYYQRVPSSAEAIRINYWAYPERMRSRYQKPTCLPEHLVEPLLVNFACADIYSEIEDGIEGTKVNTTYYETKYLQAVAELEAFLGPEEGEPQGIQDELEWDSLF